MNQSIPFSQELPHVEGSLGPLAVTSYPIAERSSEDWLKELSNELDARRIRLTLYDNYYRGNHRLSFQSSKFRENFGRLFHDLSDNFCSLVVDSVEERMNVTGFRFPASTKDDDANEADKDAWSIWQRNQLDAESQIAHTESLVKAYAYVIVWSNPDEPSTPSVTIEDAMTTVLRTHPANHRRKLVGLKRWLDDSGYLFATLYFPDRIEKWKSTKTVDPTFMSGDLQYEARDVDGEPWPLANPLGEVPIVSLTNSPRLDGTGQSEIASIIPIQDAINKLVVDMMVAAEFGAFRQRWATGVDIPVDPETNKPIEPFRSAIDRVFAVEDKDARFGEFGQTDLRPYVSAIETLIQNMASISRTPPHYFLGQSGSFPSGESLKSAETGLISKARRKMRHYGESWEAVIRLAFRVLDDPRGRIMDSETLWRDPESRSESEHVDAVLKQKAVGIPDEILWERLGYGPTEISRIKQVRQEQAMELATAFDPFRSAEKSLTVDTVDDAS